jgi:hypothetical protein
MPSASNSGASRPPGSRIVPIPNVTYSAPNIGKTIRARTMSRYLTRRTRMYGEREAEHEVDDRRQQGQLDRHEQVRQVALDDEAVVVDRLDRTRRRQERAALGEAHLEDEQQG